MFVTFCIYIVIIITFSSGEKKMAVKGKILGIDFKRDADAILLGAGFMFALSVLPFVSGPVLGVITKVRTMVGGNK